MLTIEKFISFVGDTIFTVTFVKKDGTLRVMNARLGVKKYIRGGNEIANAKRKTTLTENNMLSVYDIKEKDYRTINLNTVVSITARGITLQIGE